MEAADTLRINTAGSVDDGKSTLIGRLLYDAHGILADQLHAIEGATRKHGHVSADRTHDFSLLTDGLVAEREQGITIDVAYRYFATATRRYILADTPGHEQYTRNMVTGASNSDLAIILVDAERGVTAQTRRHLAIAALLKIPQVVVAINKMDLVAYAEAAYTSARSLVAGYARACGIGEPTFIPISALTGEMVVHRGERMPWYAGPTLMQTLESSQARLGIPSEFRVSIQGVAKSKFGKHKDLRGFWGTIASGSAQIADFVTVMDGAAPPRQVQLTEIWTGGRSVQRCSAGEPVTLVLNHQLDVSRGAWLVKPDQPSPLTCDAVLTDLCWFDSAELRIGTRYWLKHGTRMTKAVVETVEHVLDVQTLAPELNRKAVHMNDIARVTLSVRDPLTCLPYGTQRELGSFILIDDSTQNTVAAGMIVSAAAG